MLASESAAEQHGECRAVQLLEQNSSSFGLIWIDDAQSHLLATRKGMMGFLGGLVSHVEEPGLHSCFYRSHVRSHCGRVPRRTRFLSGANSPNVKRLRCSLMDAIPI